MGKRKQHQIAGLMKGAPVMYLDNYVIVIIKIEGNVGEGSGSSGRQKFNCNDNFRILVS